MIPKDPFMLLSYLNTQLRDQYESLTELCQSLNLREEELLAQIGKIDYEYDQTVNQFV